MTHPNIKWEEAFAIGLADWRQDMSKSDNQMTNNEAMNLALRFMGVLNESCEHIEVAGSVRRKKVVVNDIELVALSEDNRLWEKLDELVNRGEIKKALYGVPGTPRWNGEKYRGLMFRGKKIEIFRAPAHSYGYLLWLRTGPDNDTDRANTVVATAIKYHNPYKIRLSDGAIWWNNQRLMIRDEYDWFTLLGLRYIPPENRTTRAYAVLSSRDHEWGDPKPFVMPDFQPRLF